MTELSSVKQGKKTAVIAFGNKDEVLKVNAYLDSRGQTTKNQVRNLVVILETDLSFSSHVKAVTKSAYYHLKNIARIRCFVSSHDLEKLVHAFITSRVDYCNGLLTGLPKKTIRQLQFIQNTAARILTRTRKYEHITPVLRSLHWLPVTVRIDFKVLLLVYKSLNGRGVSLCWKVVGTKDQMKKHYSRTGKILNNGASKMGIA